MYLTRVCVRKAVSEGVWIYIFFLLFLENFEDARISCLFVSESFSKDY